MMFLYPKPLGAVLNNCPLASGLSEGISSGASISQFVLSNLRRTISIKSEREREKKEEEENAGEMVLSAGFPFSSYQGCSPRS